MVTKARDVIAAAIGGGDDPFALASFDLTTIDRDANRIRIGRRKIFLGTGFGRAHDVAPDDVTGIR